MGAKVQGPDGKEHLVSMGSYGIGPSRLVAAAIEASHDEAGIIWPKAIAPFGVGIVNMKPGDEGCDGVSEKLYEAFTNAGIDPLLDDTDNRPGSKFATMDLIGLPYQVIVGPRGVAAGEVEVKDRKTGERQNLTVEAAINLLTA
jgi:prolyl-tRNA synthetase